MDETLPPSSSSLTLIDFENKKNEVLSIGRVASMALFQEGKLHDANRVCETDPDDIDTRDLKAQIEHFIDHPDQLDLSQFTEVMEIASANSFPSRRGLLRSASERRPRRRAQLWSFDSEKVSLTNGHHDESISSTSSGVAVGDTKERTDDVFDAGSVSDGTKQSQRRWRVVGLHRSQSESSRPPVSVMQKIQSFEQRASTGKCHGKISIPANLIGESEKVPSPNRASPKGPSGKQQFSQWSPSKSNIKKEDSPAITPLSPIGQSSFCHQVLWTDLGHTVNEDFRRDLEKGYFVSPLVTTGCLATYDGDILGVTRGCRATKKEIQVLVNGMMKREYITSSKVPLAGTMYSCLSATGHVFRARTGILGVNCTTFKKTILLSFYAHPVLPKPIAKLVQDIGNTVSDFGY